MLHVFICEDDSRQRLQIESVVKGNIATEGFDIELSMSTGSPTEVLEFLNEHPDNK